ASVARRSSALSAMISSSFEPLTSLRSHNTELGQVRPQGINRLGPLPQQQVARAMLHQPALLLGRLDLHKTHGRAANRLADRFRIGRVILVALDVSLHVLRRHQANLVAEPRQLTRPIMRRGTGFYTDQ